MTDLKARYHQALQLIDLTSLKTTDTPGSITQLCHQGRTDVGHVAAVCIHSRFIATARNALNSLDLNDVAIATVANFPEGNDDIDRAVAETKEAIDSGADEIDIVFPYRAFISGNETVGTELVRHCKDVCGDHLLKVIIESGELRDTDKIQKVSHLAISAGADFIKTSTGKVQTNATYESAHIILESIRDSGNRRVGFKPAGGIRTAEEATSYLDLADEIMGTDWVNRDHFRFGASSLLKNLLIAMDLKQI